MQRTLRVDSRLRLVSFQLNLRRMSTRNHLEGLNKQQRLAVEFPPNNSLQILAGPGTGKTRVLTSRIAELVLRHSHPPESICAVTFTRKASIEMKARVREYLGVESANQLRLGTFHSVCTSYLRAYGPWVKLDPEFSIWSKTDSTLLLKYIAEGLCKGLSRKISMNKLYNLFAQAKEKARLDPCRRPEDILEASINFQVLAKSGSSDDGDPLDSLGYISEIYSGYSQVLTKSNALDFTDLLIKGLDLFQLRAKPKEIGRLKHILVDEFQDTNGIQYLILKELFKAAQGSISVVGDPDQSIYGWRGAGMSMHVFLKVDLPETKDICLEQNYRSTSAILDFSLSVISQDTTRPQKTLFTLQTPVGPNPAKKALATEDVEYTSIAHEIKRLIENSDGILGHDDCAILVRTKFIATRITPVLEAAGIPFRVLPERSLIDLPEIKTLIAFLRMIMKTSDTPMIIRTLVGPLGADKEAVTTLLHRSIEQKNILFHTLERLQNGTDPDTTPSSIGPVTTLIRLRMHLKTRLDMGATPSELLRDAIKQTDYYTYLKKKHALQYEHCIQNVQRVLQHARIFPNNMDSSPASRVYAFLNFMRDLSRAKIKTGKVTLLTCHAAKGLEWPVVFVPKVIEGVFPHAKSLVDDVETEIAQERRLLYVACTRSQSLLYMTRPETIFEGRNADKRQIEVDESRFTKTIPLELHDKQFSDISKGDLQLFKDILKRNSKDDAPLQA
ncbi:unnamed protein product [Rhizoctonia solani]|uniref:DNA 3'-5' helicase n=1 Tax=Rhizoctonia solani TaxID=456999 RepID=A0A8H3DU32_9AGAM|nr:unnamed protein product [Rhizoctonia solani]